MQWSVKTCTRLNDCFAPGVVSTFVGTSLCWNWPKRFPTRACSSCSTAIRPPASWWRQPSPATRSWCARSSVAVAPSSGPTTVAGRSYLPAGSLSRVRGVVTARWMMPQPSNFGRPGPKLSQVVYFLLRISAAQ